MNYPKLKEMFIESKAENVLNEKGDIGTVKLNKKNSQRKDYDFSKVDSIDSDKYASFINSEKPEKLLKEGVGYISIPSVDIKLPVFEGLWNEYLLLGVGTMKPNQQIGERNYALAGHTYHYGSDLLLTSIHNTYIGEKVYVTDFNRVAIYEIYNVQNIGVYDTDYTLDDKENEKNPIVTFITCEYDGLSRYLVQGKLKEMKTFDDKTEKIFIK